MFAVAALLAGFSAGHVLADGPKSHFQTQVATPTKQGDTRRDGPGRGGPPGQDVGRWWKDPQMVKELGLTPMQIGKIDRIYENRQRQIKNDVDEYNTLKAELDRLFRGRTAKPEEVERQARRLSYPSQTIIVSRTKMLYEMSMVLTAEQNGKFDQLERQRRERERGRGPGPGGNSGPR
jgi:Spy/CpxP family protein refolding chaperone